MCVNIPVCLWQVGEGKSGGTWWWPGQRMPMGTKGESPWIDGSYNSRFKYLIYSTSMWHLNKLGLIAIWINPITSLSVQISYFSTNMHYGASESEEHQSPVICLGLVLRCRRHRECPREVQRVWERITEILTLLGKEIRARYRKSTIKWTLSFAKCGCSVKQNPFFLILSLLSTWHKKITLNHGALIRCKLYYYYYP